MPVDPDLVNRIRELTATEAGLDEKRMFGGLAFLVNGHMAVAATRDGALMVRVTRADSAKLLQRDHVEPMVMGGREMRGWLRIAGPGLRTTRQLQSWVARGVDYAKSLPAK